MFNFFVKEWNDIAFANPLNPRAMEAVAKYGITNARELTNAKALQVGRLAMGSSVISMASWAWMQGKLTGNGPADRQQNQAWKAFGYKPRSIELVPGVWFNYDSIEPFNQIMSIVADIGDASQLMGEEWTERELQKISLVVAQGLTSKSYLAGMQQFVDLFGGKEGTMANIIAGLANNQLPLARIRKDLGKIFTPYTRELNSGIADSLRNRNLFMEHLPGEDIPIRYSILTGEPLKMWVPMVRFLAELTPGGFTLGYEPGAEILFNAGFDMRPSVLSSPTGISLAKESKIRSKYQQGVGRQQLGVQIEKIYETDPLFRQSMEQRHNDIRSGNRGEYENKDYYHNMVLRDLFSQAEWIAWGEIEQDEDVIKLSTEQLAKESKRQFKKFQTMGVSPELLAMYK